MKASRPLKILCVVLSVLLALGCFLLVRQLFFTKKAPAQSTQAVTGRLELYMLDVGQGEAVLAVFPEGKTLLIDCGSVDSAPALLAELGRLNVTSLDALLLTHSHSDHAGGLDALLSAVKVGGVYLGGYPKYYTGLTGILDRHRVGYAYVYASDALPMSETASVEVLSPLRDARGEEENDNCAAVRIAFGDTGALCMSDGTAYTESLLLSRYDHTYLESEVLLVGHHGSSTSSTLSFLNAVSPEYALISAGRGNEYGHPHESVLLRLRRAGAQILVTSEAGTVHMTLDGTSVSVIK